MFKSLIPVNNILLAKNGKTIPRNSNLLEEGNDHVCFFNSSDEPMGFIVNLSSNAAVLTGSLIQLKDNSGKALFSGPVTTGSQIKLNVVETFENIYAHPFSNFTLELIPVNGENSTSTPLTLNVYYLPVEYEYKLLYRKGMPLEVLQHECKSDANAKTKETSSVHNTVSPLKQVTDEVYDYNPPRYDVWYGLPVYGDYTNRNNILFHYSAYVNRSNGLLNCDDTAAVLQYKMRLRGLKSTFYATLFPFGYLAQTHLTGRDGICNNPFYGYQENRKLINQADPNRTWFRYHSFVASKTNRAIVDACAGPFYGTYLIQDYIRLAVDKVCPNPPKVNPGTPVDMILYTGVARTDLMKPVRFNSFKHVENDAAFNFGNLRLERIESHKIHVSFNSIISIIRKAGWEIYYHETVAGQIEGLQMISFRKGNRELSLKLFATNETNQYAINRFLDVVLNIQRPGQHYRKVKKSAFHQHVRYKDKGYQVNIMHYHNLVLQMYTSDDATHLTKLVESLASTFNSFLIPNAEGKKQLNIKQTFNDVTNQYRIDLLDADKDDVLEFYDVNNNCRMIDCKPHYIIFEKAKEMATVLRVWSMNNSNLSISNTKRLQIK